MTLDLLIRLSSARQVAGETISKEYVSEPRERVVAHRGDHNDRTGLIR